MKYQFAIGLTIIAAGILLGAVLASGIKTKPDRLTLTEKNSGSLFTVQTKAKEFQSKSAKNNESTQRLPAAIEKKDPVLETDLRVREFLKMKTQQDWSFEKNNSQIEKIFGGEVKKLVDTDEKLGHFVGELTTTMGYEGISFSENKEAQKTTSHEVINEYQQNIENVEIYGAYFRAFRDGDSLNASYFINEFKKYDKVNSQDAFSMADILTKLDRYYERLGKTVTQKKCDRKVYYVGEHKIAELAYHCLVTASSQLPENFEVLVSLSNSDILFQKRVSIFN